MKSSKRHEKGRYPRLITNRQKIYKITGRYIPLTRTRKDGSEYIVKVKPYCSKCKCATRKVYENNPFYGRKPGIKRHEHVGYRCPECNTLFPRTIVMKEVEEFEGDE